PTARRGRSSRRARPTCRRSRAGAAPSPREPARRLPSARASCARFLGLAAQQADDALRQEQRDRDEQRAEKIEPELGEGLREPALRAVDEERAENRPDQRAAPADRGPDR